MNDQQKKEYTVRIAQANRSGLIVILYEMFLDYVKDAKEVALENKSHFREEIRKARGCVGELMDCLDFNQEISHNLLSLYLYVDKELARANVRNRNAALSNCIKVMDSLLEAFREVSRQDTSEPVMENTQAVYAGLTYGKGNLKESLSGERAGRGLLA